MCTDVCHDRVSVIITITLFLLLPVSTAVAASSQNPLFPVEFPVAFWIGLIERWEWGVQPSKCIKSCERAQGRHARRGSGSGEREGKEAMQAADLGSGQLLLSHGSLQSAHIHTHTHTPPAAAHLLDCWHRQPPAHARLLILTESHKKWGHWAQVTVIFSFFFNHVTWKLSSQQSTDGCDPQTSHPGGFDPSVAKMLNTVKNDMITKSLYLLYSVTYHYTKNFKAATDLKFLSFELV